MEERAESGLWLHNFHPAVHTALGIQPVCIYQDCEDSPDKVKVEAEEYTEPG